MHNFIAYVRKLGNFLKSYWQKWIRKQVPFFYVGTVKGKVVHLYFQTACVTVIFKTLRLLFTSSRFLSFTNHESGKFQNCVTIKLRAWSDDPSLSGWLASSAEATFIPVSHDLGQPGVAIFIERLEAVCMFLAWFIRRAARQGRLLSQYWDPS